MSSRIVWLLLMALFLACELFAGFAIGLAGGRVSG